VSTFWHPDPEIAFWQAVTESPLCGPERSGDGLAAAGPGDDDPEPPAGVLGLPVTGADAIEVTGFGDPVRSFISLREPTAAELAEFRAAFLREVNDPVRTIVMPDVIPPWSSGTHRGACQGCGLDDDVDAWSRCAYCAELAVLRARNLPGPPLAWWWYLVPSVLGLALGLIAVWAVLYVIFC
jgi:hypothetical protein